ncbi:hypothetical protein B0H10DRAFT_2221802 [Mycena sp. CBHHK59/15]|nr:hypothetical protein B0H10DRAFT_2221802 [Mycena sp. CBHHK59/15]
MAGITAIGVPVVPVRSQPRRVTASLSQLSYNRLSDEGLCGVAADFQSLLLCLPGFPRPGFRGDAHFAQLGVSGSLTEQLAFGLSFLPPLKTASRRSLFVPSLVLGFHDRRSISWSLGLIWFFVIPAIAAGSLDRRVAQTEAQCSSDFNWAQNSIGLSPCLLTAFVWGTCFSGSWNVQQLPAGTKYDNPNGTTGTANLCTCSWAAYNLISACTACQGLDASVQNWAGYTQDCGGFLSDTYFPSTISLPGTAIPFWAGTDPRIWNDAHFDVSQAQALAKEGKPDLVQGQNSASNKNKAPIGPIVGGVIGGLAVLAIGGIVAFILIRRDRKRQRSAGETGSIRPYFNRPTIHARSMSDLSSKSILVPRSMSAVSHTGRPTTVYTTGTMRTQTGSVHSLSCVSGYTSVHQMSPGPSATQMNREDVIEPFMLRPTSPPASMARKGSEPAMHAAYTSTDNSSPAQMPAALVQDRAGTPDGSPVPVPAASPEPVPVHPTPAQLGHRTRRDKASVDSQQSYESVTSQGGESISAIDDVIGRMGLVLPPGPESVFGSVMGGHTVSTGQSENIVSRPTHKPTVSNPDNEHRPRA